MDTDLNPDVARPDHKIVCSAGVTLALNEETRTVEHLVSTPHLDRQNDVVDQRGWDLENFRKNPVVFADHDYRLTSIIGKNLELSANRNGLRAKTEIHDVGLGAAAWNLIVAGMIKGWSVGFRGKTFHSINEGVKTKCSVCKKSRDRILAGRDPSEVWIWGKHFLEQELFEYSLAAIPANPNVVMAALKKGLVDDATAPILFDPFRDGGDGLAELVDGMERLVRDSDALKVAIERPVLDDEALDAIAADVTERVTAALATKTTVSITADDAAAVDSTSTVDGPASPPEDAAEGNDPDAAEGAPEANATRSADRSDGSVPAPDSKARLDAACELVEAFRRIERGQRVKCAVE